MAETHGHEPRAGHEVTDVQIGSIVWFGIILAAVAAVVHVLLGLWMERFSDRQKAMSTPPPRFAHQAEQVPGPRLQEDPGLDMTRLSARDRERLNRYGWDPKARVARIPIDRAMQIVAETGLPARGGPPRPGAARSEAGKAGQGGAAPERSEAPKPAPLEKRPAEKKKSR